MKHLEIPNLPDEVYEQIQKLATLRGVPIASLAADLLSKAIASDDDAEARLMEEIRVDLEAMASRGVWITDQEISEAKKWGRK